MRSCIIKRRILKTPFHVFFSTRTPVLFTLIDMPRRSGGNRGHLPVEGELTHGILRGGHHANSIFWIFNFQGIGSQTESHQARGKTAGLHMPASFILSQTSTGAKALAPPSDISRFIVEKGGYALTEDWSYAVFSSAAGAEALLVCERPATFQQVVGASGYCGHEVKDARGPVPDSEAADADLSLTSCLDYREGAFGEYPKRVTVADYRETFHCLTFHTPLAGW
ncbi:MAG: hypothetical protein GY859_08460 [Desulfobacterales bacterium]|nr:hypothetical protein [Desulfobacterales bacterium]